MRASHWGVVFAQCNTTDVKSMIIEGTDRSNSVTILCGAEAKNHLGGLSQFSYWFIPPRNVDIEVEDDAS